MKYDEYLIHYKTVGAVKLEDNAVIVASSGEEALSTFRSDHREDADIYIVIRMNRI